jgi:methylmalonyl-CoA mutase
MGEELAQDVSELELAAEFPAATSAQWQSMVAKVLGGDPVPDQEPSSRLATTTADGIVISPLYVADDDPNLEGAPERTGVPGQAPFVRGRTATGNRNGWEVRQRHAQPDPQAANLEILDDLEGGVSSLWLVLGPAGIPVDSIPVALKDVLLDLAPIVLDAGAEAAAAAEAFLSFAQAQGVPAGQLSGNLGFDPLGLKARTGAGQGTEDLVTFAARCVRELGGLRAVCVDALAFHEAGATDVQELGCSLAAGVAYLRALTEGGLSLDEALGQIEFRYAATADQFTTIAKFRAARRLWARVAEASGTTDAVAGQRQHAVTSWSMMTRRDPWNNILRETLACMAAGVGGADAVTVLPFDAALGLPDALARRVARNTHALLAEESHVVRVLDPAGGSWYVEDLTEEMAQHAWTWFQQIERAGGLAAALDSGLIAESIDASRAVRKDAIAHRLESVTGVSEFPLVGEALLKREPDPVLLDPLRPEQTGGLPRVRWAQWHEELRDRADAFAVERGTPPTVLLYKLGAAKTVGLVTGLLAPAGIACTVASLDDRLPTAGVACLCTADDVPQEDIEAVAEKLAAAGATRILWALIPTAEMPQRVAVPVGVAEIVTKNMDALAFQTRTLDELTGTGAQ